MTDDFELFVATASPGLLRTAYLLTGDRVRARDLVQETLMAVQRRWPQVGDPVAYARQDLVGAVTGRRRVGELLGESPLLAGAAGLPGFAQRGTDPGPRDWATFALAGLPSRERAAVVLRFADDLPDAAVADALGSAATDVPALVAGGLGRLDPVSAGRLRSDLAGWSDPAGTPGDTYAGVLDGARDRRRHLAGLVAVLGFVVLVVVLVALTV